MTLRRTHLIYALLGLSMFGACDDSKDPEYDAGMFPALPGGPGGPGSTGGTQAGSGGTTAGVTGGLTGGLTGGITGGLTGGLTGGITGGLTGGNTGSTGGNTGSTGGNTGSTGGNTGSTGGNTGSTGGNTGSTGGDTGSTGGNTGGPGGTASCPGLPAVTDFSRPGPFGSAQPQEVVPGGEGCTLFKPAMVGMGGFKHPVVVWGNGILTAPDWYTSTLQLFASHGFMTIACNSSGPERPCLNMCMEWLIKQNAPGGMFVDKLDVTKELTMGYSWGGGASIDTADRPNVKATVSFHGMPPRNDPWARMKSPLLLFTSMGDNFVSAEGYVTPNYNSSQVPTFYATLNESVDHLYIIDGTGGNAEKERGPAIAWFRYWACGDESVKKYFFGSDCTLCKSPWTTQKKPASAWQ